jgi:hypothetical protein
MRVGGVKTIVVVLLGLVAGANIGGAQQAESQAPSESDAPKQSYTVNGLALGARVQSGSAAYKAYDCNRSELFKGLTWCHRNSTEKKSGSKINSSYSVLHSADGAVVYTNQSSEPSSFTSKEVKAEIQSLTQKYGAQPRILNMPRKPEFAEGVIAVWGDVALEPLDAASISVLATGKSPGKGLLLDFIGNLRRSAQVGLPVYRLAGGPGFVWSASYGKKGGGAVRSAAVDASAFSPSPAGRAPADSAAPVASPAPAPAASPVPSSPPVASPAPSAAPVATQAPSPAVVASPTPGPVTAPAPRPAPVVSPAPGPAPVVSAAPGPAPAASPTPGPAVATATSPSPAADKGPERDVALAELNQTIEKLKADLASSVGKIAELETAKDQAERALRQAQQARADAENDKDQAERATIAERKAFDGKTQALQILAYAAVAALIAVLAINALVFLIRRKRPEQASDEEDVSPQARSLEPETFSEPIKTEETETQYRGELVSENIFGRELERHVARINALQDETQSDPVR